MSYVAIYKGWISVASPQQNRDVTVIVAPNRFFYRSKRYVIAEKIANDAQNYGPYMSIRMWANHYKIKPIKKHRVLSEMGKINAEYNEINGAGGHYKYTVQFININDDFNFLEELAHYYHHYCIIEIAYSSTEYDMIAHELERILLLNHDE